MRPPREYSREPQIQVMRVADARWRIAVADEPQIGDSSQEKIGTNVVNGT